jgi:hypothetical protein
MRISKIAAAVALLLVLAGSTASAQVQLTIRNGRVTIVAKDATVRQILAEWARVGQTRIVNAERLPGGPLTLRLTDVPEEQALDLLLRNVSGYMAARRVTADAALSRYDRILVMPTAAPVRQALASAPPVLQQQPVAAQQANDDNADDDRPVTTVVTPPRGPVFTTFQQAPAAAAPAAPPAPVPNGAPQFVPAPAAADQPPPQSPPNLSAPSSAGVARPGMIVQPPAQPGQTQPGQTQPAR